MSAVSLLCAYSMFVASKSASITNPQTNEKAKAQATALRARENASESVVVSWHDVSLEARSFKRVSWAIAL